MMALSWKVMGAGVPELFVRAGWKDVNATVSAAGTNQATATELKEETNYVSTVASGTGVILSSLASAGDEQTVYNAGANPLKIYPQSGAKINQIATNSPHVLPPYTMCEYFKVTATRWIGQMSA